MLALLFADKFNVSTDRIPSFLINISGTTFGIFLPSATLWTQLLVGLIFSQLFVVAAAGIVYHFIIPNRGSTTTYLIGFGIVCPLLLTYPFWIINALEIKNGLLRFSLGAILPVTSMFHCTEAMFGFSPHSVETSFRKYVLYYISAVEIVFDEKTNKVVKASWPDILSRAKTFAYNVLITGAYHSIMQRVQYQPFENHTNANTLSFSELDLFHGIFDWKLTLNNLASTIMLQLYISTFASALCFILSALLRVKTCVAMHNPLLLSSSPSDFWGRRWNMIIHKCLKRGVFKPVYRYSTKSIAVWATFIASGLMHEYLLIVICDTPDFGKQTAFFIWNAIIVTLEHFFGKAFIFQWIHNTMPKPVVGVLVVCTVMPITHWFLHPLTKNSLQEHSEFAFPMVVAM